ncbi:MAG: hypothetical protein QOI34_1458 [Verrucomicrobiota bacterium]
MLARVTVYWRGEGSQERACSNGARLRSGNCAVDPKKIPYGSKVVFPDGPCLAVDTGPAVVSRKAARLAGRTTLQRAAVVIDRYFETKTEALAWAGSHPHFMMVQILDSHRKGGDRSVVAGEGSIRINAAPALIAAPVAMTKSQKLKDIYATVAAFISPADVRGPYVPTFLATRLID